MATLEPAQRTAELRKELLNLQALEAELTRRENLSAPASYGLPNLLDGRRQYEPEGEFLSRQNQALKEMVEKSLWVEKDGVTRHVKMIPPMLEFVADMFYGRTDFAILWKCRGGGGSLAGAIVIWLRMVYHKQSWMDMGGCLLPETWVVTSRGFVMVRDVVAGDRVLSGDGQFHRVVRSIRKRWDGQIMRLKVGGWPEIGITPDHRVVAVTGLRRPSGKLYKFRPHDLNNEWVEAGRVKRLDYGRVPVWKPEKREKTPVMLVNAQNGSGGSVRVDDRPGFYRFVGYWLAEGSNYWLKGKAPGGYVSLDARRGEPLVADSVEIAKSVFERDAYVSVRGENECRFRIGHSSLAEWLENTFGHGAKGKDIPIEWLESLTVADMRELLTGYLRGDGSLSKTGIAAYTASSGLACKVMLMLQIIGAAVSVGREKEKKEQRFVRASGKTHIIRGGPGWKVCATGDAARDLALEIFGRRPPLDGKKRRTSRLFLDGCWQTGLVARNVEAHYKGDVYDLTIDGDEHNFSLPGLLVHNSGEQAKVVYEYTKQFWKCVQGMPDKFLASEPTMSKTVALNGAELVCVACSDKAVRGKHKSGFLGDESCSKDEGVGVTFEAAMQGSFSEPDPKIMLMSTFHWPFGFFQEYWDNAPEKGFKRYRWDIFDTMQPCRVGLEEATKEDPKALSFCRNKCPLTTRREAKDEAGAVIDTMYEECAGKARDSHGWQSFDQVLKVKTINAGGLMWKVEHCCQRPKVRGNVYSPDRIENAMVKTAIPFLERRWRDKADVEHVEKPGLCVGLDWGLMSMAVGVLVGPTEGGLCAPEAKVFEGDSATQIGEFILGWQDKYQREITVYGDAEETYGNQQIELLGLRVVPVPFGTWKDWGVSNLNFWLEYARLKLVDEGDMARVVIPQMKKMHTNQLGRIVKKDDHGPDALMCGVLSYDFLELLSNVVRKQGRMLAGVDKPKPAGDADITVL